MSGDPRAVDLVAHYWNVFDITPISGRGPTDVAVNTRIHKHDAQSLVRGIVRHRSMDARAHYKHGGRSQLTYPHLSSVCADCNQYRGHSDLQRTRISPKNIYSSYRMRTSRRGRPNSLDSLDGWTSQARFAVSYRSGKS